MMHQQKNYINQLDIFIQVVTGACNSQHIFSLWAAAAAYSFFAIFIHCSHIIVHKTLAHLFAVAAVR